MKLFLVCSDLFNNSFILYLSDFTYLTKIKLNTKIIFFLFLNLEKSNKYKRLSFDFFRFRWEMKTRQKCFSRFGGETEKISFKFFLENFTSQGGGKCTNSWFFKFSLLGENLGFYENSLSIVQGESLMNKCDLLNFHTKFEKFWKYRVSKTKSQNAISQLLCSRDGGAMCKVGSRKK